jgi:hemoglobin
MQDENCRLIVFESMMTPPLKEELPMTRTKLLTGMMTVLLITMTMSAVAVENSKESAKAMTGLQGMCDETQGARTARHAKEVLYDRLGGYDKILALTTEIVRLHAINDEIKHTVYGVDHGLLAKNVADFVASGTGGTTKYTARDLPTSHKKMNLTDADFLSAGGDVIKAMQNLKYGQNEIDEIVCILVSLKDQVVFR